MRRHTTTEHVLRWAGRWAPLWASVACGTTATISEPAFTTAPAMSTSTGVERFAIRKGDTHMLGTLELFARDLGDDSATIITNDGAAALGLGRCERGRDHMYVLESVDAPRSRRPIGNFARVALTEPVAATEGHAVQQSARDTLLTSNGTAISVSWRSAGAAADGWPLVLSTRGSSSRRDMGMQRKDGAFTAAIDATHLLAVRWTDAVDVLGCPILDITLERHDELLVDVVANELVRVEAGHSVRLDGIVVGNGGWGERMVRDGPASVWIELDIELGDTQKSRRCSVKQTCAHEGYEVEVIEAGPREALLRVRHRPPSTTSRY